MVSEDYIKVGLYFTPHYASYCLYFWKGENKVIKEIIWEEQKNGMYRNPDISLDEMACQTLMDDLWSAGIRPTQGKGSAGSLKATENHLSDMRIIAFNRLKIKE